MVQEYNDMKDSLSRIIYDPDTGDFTWVRCANRRVSAGQKAGCLNYDGYVVISLGGVVYRAHRLAWHIVHGCWPSDQLDHINGNRADNRIANLREATAAQNHQNIAKRSDNKSGYPGVSYAPWASAWRAEIRVSGARRRIGYFSTPELAYAAYSKAKAELHTFHPEVPQR